MDLFKNIIIKLNTIYENVEALIGPISDIEQQKKNRTLMKCQNWIDFKTISIKFQYNIDTDNKLLRDKFCFDWKKNWILKKFNLLILYDFVYKLNN